MESSSKSEPVETHARVLQTNLQVYRWGSLLYLLAAAIVSPTGTGSSFCIFYGVTGIPCPGCGMTRALSHIVHGDLFGAVGYHIFSYLLLPLLLYFVLTWWIKPLERLYYQRESWFNFAMLLSGGGLFLFGVLRALALLYFPDHLPEGFHTFQDPSILESLPFWKPPGN